MNVTTTFLSSTAKDLARHRQVVYDALESLDGYHCIRMENFGARDFTAEHFDRARIECCDLFIGIIGYYYGNIPHGRSVSFTELEYEAAVDLSKPRIIFLSSTDVPIYIDLKQSEQERRKQETFRQRLSAERIVGFFSSPTDLAAKVVTAIFNFERDKRGDYQAVGSLDYKWSLVPRLPHPHLAHPYPLQDHFTGRVQERRMLSGWLSDSRHPFAF